MTIKVNFAPENTTVSEGFILDSGLGYDAARGYGWVTQDSLDNGNPTPIDLSSNTRDRSEDNDGTEDSLIHLQYPTDLISPLAESSIKTPSAWEYDLANGSYYVTVVAGDPEFTDSSHTVNVEGESAISGFVPTEDNLFTESTVLVEVTDGRLTIDAVGGDNTKLTSVEIVPEADFGNGNTDSTEPIEPENSVDSGNNAETVRFNFGSPTVSPPEGFIQDMGAGYDDGRGFGWITQDSVGSGNSTPINISPNTRDRNSVQEDAFDSLVHLQYPENFDNQNAVTTPAAWEYELANGQYTVTVVVGDPIFEDSNHVINVEGNSVISGFTPTESELFTTATTVVEVTDGRLTIDAIGGENTKLNFVEITPGDVSDTVNISTEVTPIEMSMPTEGAGVVEIVQPVAGGFNINFGTAGVSQNNGFIQDAGAGYNDSRGYGWITQDSVGSGNSTPINLYANARDRNTLFSDGQGGMFQEPTRDSLIHMQYPTGLGNSDISVTTPAAWEFALANGQYEVTVGVGDSDFFDSSHVINVEGVSVINGFVPSSAESFTTGTATVDVNDGRLTIDAIGGENTKINYVTIVPVEDI